MYKIQTLDRISAVGLDNFPRGEYEIASEIMKPDAILVRSHDMLTMELDEKIVCEKEIYGGKVVKLNVADLEVKRV